MNPLNLSRVVNNPALQKNFTVQRNQYQMQNEGEWTKVATQTFNAAAVITPTSGKDKAEFLPEGQRFIHAITLYSPTALLNADGNTQESDVIIWNGGYYRVQFSKPWAAIAGYWFVIATGFVHHAS
jgi:hypothetical protein